MNCRIFIKSSVVVIMKREITGNSPALTVATPRAGRLCSRNLLLEHVSQLELNEARRVPLLRDAPEVRVGDVGVLVVPEHVVECVDHIQPELERLLLRDLEAAQDVGVELVLAVTAQPIERSREDAAMERIWPEVVRRGQSLR